MFASRGCVRRVAGRADPSCTTLFSSFVYREVPEEELHIPLSQIIYLGDGASDLPVFGLLHDHGGVALGIFKGDSAEEWRAEQELDARQRVENLARADYAEDSELMRSLTLAVESVCKRIALRVLSVGE